MHFRTIFLTQTEIWKVIPFNPLTFMFLFLVNRGNSDTANIFSASEKNSFICSESRWMLSVAPWLHNSPSVTCLEFTTKLPIDRNWRIFIGVSWNFPYVSQLILTVCCNNCLQVHPRFYTNACAVHNLQINTFALASLGWMENQLCGWGAFLDHSSSNRKQENSAKKAFSGL